MEATPQEEHALEMSGASSLSLLPSFFLLFSPPSWLLFLLPITDEFEKAQREREKEKKRRAKQKKKENRENDEREAIEAKRREELEQIEAEQRRLETIKNAGECAACQISLYGKKVLDVLDKKCCSGPCVIKCRRQLQAQAAERRFGVIK